MSRGLTMCRFIKLIQSDETDFLQENHPKAFLLLIQIAKTARRTAGGLDGLEIGDAIIGRIETSKKAGLSQKEYRNALDKLIELGYVEVVYDSKSKKHQKRAIKRAIKSTVVNLLKLDICDINPEYEGQQVGQQGANKGPTEGHKQERTRKNKKEEETTTTPLPPKVEEKPAPVVVVLYDCLKENKDLTDDEKECLMQYAENRVKLALKFAETEKPTTTLIQMLVWHCQAKVPPQPSGNRLTEQQKMAIEFNKFLLTIGYELIYEQNKALIKDGGYVNGPFGPLSLKNDTRTLRQDFDEIKSAFRKQRRYG